MLGLDLTHSPTIFVLGNACSGSEVSAVQLLHDHVLKFQKDGFNDNLERNLSLIFATYLCGTVIISKLVEGLLKSGTI